MKIGKYILANKITTLSVCVLLFFAIPWIVVSGKVIKVDPMTITDEQFLDSIEKISGRQIKESRPLQERAARAIAKKYNMKNAEIVILVSFSGPRPPEGGYVYWGVRGQLDGKWVIWQPYTNPPLRPGRELEDPKRYQKCNSPQTKILTSIGYIAIVDLKVGDMVMTETNQFVPVLKISKVKATNHHVSLVHFDNGSVVQISPTHPLADGRFMGQLKPGDKVGTMHVVSAQLIFYEYEYTYDILPDSPSANYYAEGILLKSTISVAKKY
ncbi:MAG: Hint domain-containing protein [Leptospirales bacterium]